MNTVVGYYDEENRTRYPQLHIVVINVSDVTFCSFFENTNFLTLRFWFSSANVTTTFREMEAELRLFLKNSKLEL